MAVSGVMLGWWSAKNIPWAKTVLMDRMRREKKVVVPTSTQRRWPNKTQETNAPHSSIFQGRMLLMEAHLKRTFIRCQNPVAAASSSSLVGLCGILGMCRYFETVVAIDSSCSG